MAHGQGETPIHGVSGLGGGSLDIWCCILAAVSWEMHAVHFVDFLQTMDYFFLIPFHLCTYLEDLRTRWMCLLGRSFTRDVAIPSTCHRASLGKNYCTVTWKWHCNGLYCTVPLGRLHTCLHLKYFTIRVYCTLPPVRVPLPSM